MKLYTLDEGAGIALESLRTNRLRSSLTILGVAIGVAVVVVVAALITGIRTQVLEGFEASGPDNFIVTPFDFTEVRLVGDGSGRPPWWDKPEITDEEIRLLSRIPGVHEAIVAFDFITVMDFEGRRIGNIQAVARSPGWPEYTVGEFIAGRNFTPSEAEESAALVVLSSGLAEDLFGERDPIGKRLRVSGPTGRTSELFSVIGVFEPEQSIFTEAFTHWAVFPPKAASKRLKALWRWNFASVLIVPDSTVDPGLVQDRAIAVLRSARGLRPGEENNFAVTGSDQLVEILENLTGVFLIIMISLSSVGLLVGGVGVVGIMMISVTERTREIGIRKSVGATRQEILWQFLVEAGVLTLIGGALGMLVGATGALTVAHLTPIPASIPLWSVLAALAMAALTGVLFGMFPAYRASQLDPVAALRYE